MNSDNLNLNDSSNEQIEADISLSENISENENQKKIKIQKNQFLNEFSFKKQQQFSSDSSLPKQDEKVTESESGNEFEFFPEKLKPKYPPPFLRKKPQQKVIIFKKTDPKKESETDSGALADDSLSN
ncbi:hypothetical protein M0811_14101 [Anaeramoeba ignava]|uniref:Uncharacterized protein n=1 Tax=Anaeramoeba ignava TaxID=1746090 RepID=A0A9Q0RGJ7_ANAIG|nr:hypothetical protein M0811_14101 [Anaeramoeba ignava]